MSFKNNKEINLNNRNGRRELRRKTHKERERRGEHSIISWRGGGIQIKITKKKIETKTNNIRTTLLQQ